MQQQQQSAFAYQQQKKKGAGRGQQENSKNGNTLTIEECKNKWSASGFDTTVNQECENLICTHPGGNATCTEEGVRSISTPTPTPEPTTTTLRIIKRVVCQPTDPNCSLPATCIIGLQTTSQKPQAFTCQSAVGNGLLFTLQPGDNFFVGEGQTEPGPIFDVSMGGDCSGTIAAGQHLTCTVTNTEPPT